MPKRLFYGDGPDKLKIGHYEFERGVVTEVPDDIAEILIRKGRVQEYVEPKSIYIEPEPTTVPNEDDE
jgi:hypothetical protein